MGAVFVSVPRARQSATIPRAASGEMPPKRTSSSDASKAKSSSSSKADGARTVAAPKSIAKRRRRDHAAACTPLAVTRARDLLFRAADGKIKVANGHARPVRLSQRFIGAVRMLTHRFMHRLSARVARSVRAQRVQTVRPVHWEAAVMAELGTRGGVGGHMVTRARDTVASYRQLRREAAEARGAHKE